MKIIELVKDINKENKRSFLRLLNLNKRLKKNSDQKAAEAKVKL